MHIDYYCVCRRLFSFFLYVIFIYNISLLSYSITIASVCCSYSSKKLCMYLIEYDPFFLLIVTFSFFLFCLHIEDSIISALFVNIPFFIISSMLRDSAIFHFTNVTIILTLLRCWVVSLIFLYFFSLRDAIYIRQCTQCTLLE